MNKTIFSSAIILILFLTINIDNCNSQWVRTNGPYGGTVKSLHVSGSNIFAGAYGVFMSENNGLTWLPTELNDANVTSIASSGSYIFAGTETGLWRSTNNGQNWARTILGYGYYVTALIISGSNIFAGTSNNGIYLSTNNGQSWAQTGSGFSSGKQIASFAVEGSYIYAASFYTSTGVGDNIYYTTNNGQNWIATNYNNIGNTAFTLAVNNSKIYTGTRGHGVYYSTNHGINWSQAGLEGSYVHSLAVNDSYIYAGVEAGGVYRSTNNGLNWSQSFVSTQWIYSLALKDSYIFAGAITNGIFQSANNGLNWTQSVFSNNAVRTFLYDGPYIFAGTDIGVFRSADNGQNWTRFGTLIQNIYSLVSLGGGNYLAGTASGIYIYSTVVNDWIFNNFTNLIWTFAKSGSYVFAGMSTNGVYYTTNNGQNWTQTPLNNMTVFSLALSGSNIYAGTQDSGVYLSTNNGAGWVHTSLNNKRVFCLSASGPYIYAGINNGSGVFVSTNYGTVWSQTALNSQSVFSVLAVDSGVFAGTYNNGIYFSANKGQNWVQKNEGFTVNPSYIYSLFFSNNYIFAGSAGYSVLRRPYSDFITYMNRVGSEIPRNFKLEQNYPNPFNPSTNIRYELPVSGIVRLVISDLLGREIETLVNAKQSAGTYETVWDASHYSGGVYFYRLTIEGFSESKKMILVK